MVAMRMSDENMRHRLAAHRVQQRRDMGIILRAGIDNGDAALPDDVAHRAFEGERTGIVAENPPHPGYHLLDVAGRKLQHLVKRNVVVTHRMKFRNSLCAVRAAAAYA